jgi:hypothetical protein
MNDRQDLLRKLVIYGHVNVPERQTLGIVRRQEVKELVKSLLLIHGSFPFEREGRAVYEGATLNRNTTGIVIIWRRAYAWDPFTLAESRTETFIDLDAAVERFVESEWSSGIDGISLE